MSSPPPLKQPIGKIALALFVVLLAIFVAWFFLKEDSSQTTVVEEKDLPAKDLSDNSPPGEFVDYPLPEAKPELFSGDDPPGDPAIEEESSRNVRYAEEVVQVGSINVIEESVQETEASTPAPIIVGGPDDSAASVSPVFRLQASGRTRCSLNEPNFRDARSCGRKIKFHNLRPGGRYLFRAWQIQNKKVSYPAWYLFYVKQAPPVAPQFKTKPSLWSKSKTATFTWKSVKGEKYVCRILGVNKNCKSPRTYKNIPDGKYTFSVRAERGEETSAWTSYTWNVDTTPPAAPTIVSEPVSPAPAGPITWTWRGERGAAFLCTLNGGVESACSSPQTYNLGPGEYTFSVSQVDQAGNRSPASVRNVVVESLASVSASVKSRSMLSRGFSADSSSNEEYIPENQETSEETTFTVNVLAAIEISDPADDSDAVAPVAGAASTAIADLDMNALLRSNLSWNVASATAGKLSGGSTGSRDLIADLSGDSGSVAAGSRNSSDSAQSVSADYDQAVSWGDEAGPYVETITHTATQTLGQ